MMGWARVVPSRCLLLFILLTTTVTVCVCVTACVVLWLSPQVPYSEVYGRGDYTRYPALLLAVTALLSGISVFLGSCGLSRDSKALLIIYSVMVLVVIVGELTGAGTVFSFAYTGELQTEVGNRLKNDVMVFLNADNSSITCRINSLQIMHSCCGVDSYNDWKHLNTSWERKEAHGQLAPESCCKSEFSAEQNCTFNSSMLHHNGCVHVLMFRLDIAIDCVLGACIGSTLLNLVTVLLACRGVWLIRRYQNYNVL